VRLLTKDQQYRVADDITKYISYGFEEEE